MAFMIKGFNTEENEQVTKNNTMSSGRADNELMELDAFASLEKQAKDKEEQEVKLKNQEKTIANLEAQIAQLQQAQSKETTQSQQAQSIEKSKPVETPPTEKKTTIETQKASEHVTKEQEDTTKKSTETFVNSSKGSIGYNNTASDILESTFEVFEGLGDSLHQVSGMASKLKQTAHIAWSVKQDNEIKHKFKNAPKVNAGDYTFKVLMQEKEIMIYSYQGPNTVLKMPSEIKGMKITAIDQDFLKFRAPKALLNAMSGSTIGTDLDALKQCITCVKQLRLPEHLVYVPGGLFRNCNSLDVVIIPKEVIGLSVLFLEGSFIKRVLFEGACPAGLQHAEIPRYTKISCRKEYLNTFKGMEVSVI